MLACLLIMYYRAPTIIRARRFWAEDFLFFRLAYAGGPLGAVRRINLLHYLSLWPALAAAGASLVQLESASLVVMAFAAIAQLLPVLLVLSNRSSPWHCPLGRLLGVSILLLLPLGADTWLNTVNSQFHFAIAVFLILIEDTETLSRLRVYLNRVVLLVAGLTGPVSCFLLPLFVLDTMATRNQERWRQSLILGLATVLQASALLLTPRGPMLPARAWGFDLIVFAAATWTQSIGLTLFGWSHSLTAISAIDAVHSLGQEAFLPLGLLLATVEVVLFTVLSRQLDRLSAIRMVGSYLLFLLPSLAGALGKDRYGLVHAPTGARYFLAPNFVFLTTILAASTQRYRTVPRTAIGRLIAAALLILFFVHWIPEYDRHMYAHDEWPDWREEIALWREDPSYVIQVWPPGWKGRLPTRDQ